MLAKIARRKAINFLNVAFRKWEIAFGGELPGLQERSGAPEVNPITVLGDILAEGLGMEAFQLDQFVNKLVEEAGLDVVEQYLLKEHMVDYCTQPEFSDLHSIHLNLIGRIKDRLITKIRSYLAGQLRGEARAEYSQILRRNR